MKAFAHFLKTDPNAGFDRVNLSEVDNLHEMFSRFYDEYPTRKTRVTFGELTSAPGFDEGDGPEDAADPEHEFRAYHTQEELDEIKTAYVNANTFLRKLGTKKPDNSKIGGGTEHFCSEKSNCTDVPNGEYMPQELVPKGQDRDVRTCHSCRFEQQWAEYYDMDDAKSLNGISGVSFQDIFTVKGAMQQADDASDRPSMSDPWKVRAIDYFIDDVTTNGLTVPNEENLNDADWTASHRNMKMRDHYPIHESTPYYLFILDLPLCQTLVGRVPGTKKTVALKSAGPTADNGYGWLQGNEWYGKQLDGGDLKAAVTQGKDKAVAGAVEQKGESSKTGGNDDDVEDEPRVAPPILQLKSLAKAKAIADAAGADVKATIASVLGDTPPTFGIRDDEMGDEEDSSDDE